MKAERRLLIEKQGRKIYEYHLINDNKVEVKIMNLGAIITDILIPDYFGNIENVVVKWKDVLDYIDDGSCAGAVVGRTAGRIADGNVSIGGKCYKLSQNQGVNTLHGGENGLNKKIWKGFLKENTDEMSVVLETFSQDGEDGYPGNVKIKVIYTLNNKNELKIEYSATSDKDTLINLTNHSYFNLSGNLKTDILGEKLTVKSSNIATIREDSAPSGEVLSVKGTPFDFRLAKEIGKDIRENHRQLILGNGYDHPWILDNVEGPCVILEDKISGRKMEVTTDRKAVVIYSTNYPEQQKKLFNGETLKKNQAICFETQNLPIGENERFIEGSIVKAEEEYKAVTTFKFIF